MDINILDSLYRRVEVVDNFISLIWTERFAAIGDFELHTHSTLENRKRFFPGVRLSLHESFRVMTVETVEDAVDDEGRRVLKITGPSLENVLTERVAMAALTDLATDPQWILTGPPRDLATQLFHDICVLGTLSANDIIAGVNEANIFPADTIPEPTDDIVYVIDPIDLYSAIKKLCDTYFMGFRLVRDHDTTQLYFDVYMGCDRTTQQTTLPAVIFSPELENLDNTRKLTSSALYKNVAYVVSPVGHEIVVPDDVDPSIDGFDRRVLLVKADDITDVVPADATAKMIQRGREELAKNRQFVGLDGEVNQTSQFVYGTHYNLGDLVTEEDDDGAVAQVRVTEQIFVSDESGDRSYPTLSAASFINAGAWNAWPAGQAWNDVSPTLVWDDAS